MKPPCHYLIIACLLCAFQPAAFTQQSIEAPPVQVPAGYFNTVSQKAARVHEKLDAKTSKVLGQFRKQQDKIRAKLSETDSLAANNIFTAANERYSSLENKLNNPQQLTQYIPFLDTLKTSLKFLNKNKELLDKAAGTQVKLDESLAKINWLENEIQKAEDVKQFLKQEGRLLKEQLEKFGFAKQLKKLNKQSYYYGQQINEYKELIKNPKKIERKAIELISRTKLFQDFMKKNSMLASLFRMPADDPNDPAYLQSLAGLQTRAQVNQLIQDRVGSGGPDAMQQLQGNVQQAQGELQKLKDKISQYGSGAADGDMPDFKPNNQKTKTFLQRLEYGTNIQSQRSNGLLPVTSDFGFSAGYKINANSVVGVGSSYKMGWGKNIQHIRISHQGVSLRSYIDIKLKKTIWLSGGYEMNYHDEFNSIEQLKQYNSWQQSGLIGLTKRIPIHTRFFNNSKIQLLWDLLSYRQVPRSQPLVFRIGYNLK